MRNYYTPRNTRKTSIIAWDRIIVSVLIVVVAALIGMAIGSHVHGEEKTWDTEYPMVNRSIEWTYAAKD